MELYGVDTTLSYDEVKEGLREAEEALTELYKSPFYSERAKKAWHAVLFAENILKMVYDYKYAPRFFSCGNCIYRDDQTATCTLRGCRENGEEVQPNRSACNGFHEREVF